MPAGHTLSTKTVEDNGKALQFSPLSYACPPTCFRIRKTTYNR